MRVYQDSRNLPHSSGERAGETTSPVMRPRLLKNPKMSPIFICRYEHRHRVAVFRDHDAFALGPDLVDNGETIPFEHPRGHRLHFHFLTSNHPGHYRETVSTGQLNPAADRIWSARLARIRKGICSSRPNLSSTNSINRIFRRPRSAISVHGMKRGGWPIRKKNRGAR
jgi:hypothetical protein